MKELRDKITLKDQTLFLKQSVQLELPFSEYLETKGLSYDNLRYNKYNNNLPSTTALLRIEDLHLNNIDIPTVSFFSGAGGLDLGFEYAGFKTVASVENVELFCKTLRFNNPHRPVIGPPDYSGDISKREEIASILKEKVGLKTPFEGVFHGGPPCQPFSMASNQRFRKEDSNFKRKGFEDGEKGNLLFDYIWLIENFKPKAFVIENVPGLKDMDTEGQLSNALIELTKMGYKITNPTILNAADFGVPQSRTRLFIVGIRDGEKYHFPTPSIVQMPCVNIFEQELIGLKNHETRKHTASSVLRYMELDYGARDQLGRVDRLNPYLPSKTVIAGGTKGGGRSHLHPYIPRTLSVRESARIQTFPDNYEFLGPTARQFTQVGNAVPPKLAYAIARELRNKL